MMRQAFVLLIVIACSGAAHGQISHMTGGVKIVLAENVQFAAQGAEHNQQTGEIVFFGDVALSQARRPAVNVVQATNQAGAPFPEVGPVMFRMRNVELAIGKNTVTADEAEVNGLTGEMVLRGNVRLRRAR